jgi:hypothetical protein
MNSIKSKKSILTTFATLTLASILGCAPQLDNDEANSNPSSAYKYLEYSGEEKLFGKIDIGLYINGPNDELRHTDYDSLVFQAYSVNENENEAISDALELIAKKALKAELDISGDWNLAQDVNELNFDNSGPLLYNVSNGYGSHSITLEPAEPINGQWPWFIATHDFDGCFTNQYGSVSDFGEQTLVMLRARSVAIDAGSVDDCLGGVLVMPEMLVEDFDAVDVKCLEHEQYSCFNNSTDYSPCDLD